jgi:hypothetical protein
MPVELRIPGRKLLGQVVACVAFLFGGWLGLYLLSVYGQAIRGMGLLKLYVLLLVGAWACVILSALGLLNAVWRVFQNKPAMVIDEEGLTGFTFGFVPWDDIAVVRYYNVAGQVVEPHLEVEVHDPEAVLARMPLVQRKLCKLNVDNGGPLLMLPLSFLPVSYEELREIIEEFRPGVALPRSEYD